MLARNEALDVLAHIANEVILLRQFSREQYYMAEDDAELFASIAEQFARNNYNVVINNR